MTPQQTFLEQFQRDPEGCRRRFARACRGRHLEHAPILPAAMLVDAATRRRIARACQDLAIRLEQRVQRDWSLATLIDYGLPESVARLALLDDGPGRLQAAWRFDLSDNGERVSILECNAADPSGLGWVDQLSLAVWNLPPTRALRRDPGLARRLVVSRWRRLLGPDPVVTVCPTWSFVHYDHHALADLLQRQGRRAWARDPAQGIGDCGTLCRDALDELVDHYPRALEELLEARRRGVPLLNPLGSAAAEPKAWLARLSQEQQLPYLPWTRTLDWKGETPPRAQLVLKPSFGYGGLGVTLGSQVSDSQWREALAQSPPRAWVLQQYCPLPVLELPDSPPLQVTLSAWVVAGRFAGMLARGSFSAVTNVNQGGALLPVLYY